jgi:ADP-heptose:LPS heptosyltransferase/GT2 family glycosyltransferase
METVVSEAPAVAQTPFHAERSCIITVERVGINGVETRDGQTYLSELTISGWVVCKEAVEQLVFEHQGLVMGVAVLGLHRPDVAAAHPSFPGSDHAGFTAVISHVRLVNGSLPTINASVRTRGGKRYGGRLQIQTSGAARGALPNAASEVAGSALPMEGVVDVAVLDASGRLRVEGWALAPVGIVSVRILAGDQLLGLATLGLGRSDVAASYPAYADADRSGFGFEALLPAQSAETMKRIQIEVVARNGATRVISAELLHQDGGLHATPASPPLVAPAPALGSDEAKAAVQCSCDIAEVDAKGRGIVSGWAVSPNGIKRISVSTGEVTLGEVRPELLREDVAAAFPAIPGASRSGFICRFEIADPAATNRQVKLQVEDNHGETLELVVTLVHRETLSIEPVQQPSVSSASDDFRFYLDSPAIQGARVIDPVTGAVTVAGWAVAQHGLKSIAVSFGDVLIGNARLGARRPDIAAIFPGWPDALMSGFGLFVPAGMLSNGHQKLTLVLTDKRNAQRVERFDVEVRKTAAGEGDRPLRRKVSEVETDTCRRIVQRAGVEVAFAALVSVANREQARKLLPLTFRSLAEQTYRNWTLTIVVPASRNRKLIEEIRSSLASGLTERVRIKPASGQRLGELLDHAAGEVGGRERYALSLRVGDEIAADCLMQFALSNVGVPMADFAYGDERRQCPKAGRVSVFLKPEWSPELLLSTNYIGRCWFARLELMADVFESVDAYFRAVDYERVLRLTERACNIRRVPKVLVERNGDQWEDAGLEMEALRRAAARRAIPVSIEPTSITGTYRFHRALARPGMVSIIIPSIAARGLVKTCLESVRRSGHKEYEVILIDNIQDASSEWKQWFRANADRVIEVPDAFNWSLFNNIGAEHARGDYLLFLNDDIEVLDPHWLETLMEIAQSEDVGVVGPYLLYPDRSVQHAGLFLSGPGTARHAFRFTREDDPGYFGLALTQRDMIGVTGACMMMRREVFDALGGFNPAHSVINNDLDFCLRCHDVGLSVVYTPHTRLVHHELASRERLPDAYDAEVFLQEWSDIFSRGDPYYHPELSCKDDCYSIDTEFLREVYAGFPVARKRDVKRIVVFKLDHIGDFITALPAIRRLKEKFVGATLSVVVSPAVAVLARSQESIDEVFEFAFFHARSGLGQRPVSDAELLALKEQLEPRQFDLAVDLRKHPDTRQVLQYSGARFLAGFDRANSFPWLDFALEWEGDPPWVNKRQHVAADLLNLTDAIANACEEDRNVLRRRVGPPAGIPPSIARLDEQLWRRPVVGIHPASGNELRQWPAEHFATLIDMLVTRLPVHVAIIGGPDEKELADKVLAKVRNRTSVWSLVGVHKLSELPDVLASFALFVGNNSGPKHVAAGLGVPTVAVHSAVVSTEEWGPLGANAVAIRKDMSCAPCYRAALQDCHRDIACMREIDPEHVYALCLRFLALAEPRETGDIGGRVLRAGGKIRRAKEPS